MNPNEFEEVINDNEEIVNDNEEIVEGISGYDPTDIVVYSRDWTIETIYNQIKINNIDLNPKFQRRNAWNDHKRSNLIESIIIGYPVPEIVLAENPKQKKSFIVIDGKQRLLTIAGYIQPELYEYWDTPNLSGLKVKSNLNGVKYNDLVNEDKFGDELRQFNNSSLRCTIITNFKENDILYDIFYRLNSGSVPLSTQELRQVLNRGEFANYLISITNSIQPLHKVMKLKEPDNRLRDIEILLRCFSMILFASTYTGNLKTFLDDSMSKVNNEWTRYESAINELYGNINKAIEILKGFFGDYHKIGRKYTNGTIEKRFNRVLLEVQVFYFIHLDESIITDENRDAFITGFQKLCQDDFEFRSSIQSSTNTLENYKVRFGKFQDFLNQSLRLEINVYPF